MEGSTGTVDYQQEDGIPGTDQKILSIWREGSGGGGREGSS